MPLRQSDHHRGRPQQLFGLDPCLAMHARPRAPLPPPPRRHRDRSRRRGRGFRRIDCFAPFINDNGATRAEAFEKCTPVPDPSQRCGPVKPY